MTPSALTPAARRTANRPPRANGGRPSSGRAAGSTAGAAAKKPVRAAAKPTRAAAAKPGHVRAPARAAAKSGHVRIPARAATKSGRPAATGTATRAASTGTSAQHRSPLRPGLAPRTARRVSGPLGGLARARVSTPAKPPAAPRRPVRRSRASAVAPGTPWPARAAAYVRALPDHALLDRLIRGRVWIPLLGVLLAGIVAMQVEVLKLNATTAASLQRTTTLQNERDQLQASVAQLGDEQRIESLAARMGMVMPQPAQMKFLSPGPSTTSAAVGNIHAPDATTFAASLPSVPNPLTAGSSAPTTAAPAAATGTAAPATGTATPAAPATGTATPAAPAAGTATTPAPVATPTAPASAGTATTPAG